MMASRGMGDIAPSKMPKGKKKARRDDTDFTQYKEGGKVNAAGNYTKPSLRKKIVSQVKPQPRRVLVQVSGQRVKLSLLPRSTRRQAGVTEIESASKIIEGLGRPKMENQKW
jgi:hypothetical protein